jgi:ADP-heptose:LPS heptosyltransferase
MGRNIISSLALGDFVIDYLFLEKSKFTGKIYCPNYIKPLAQAMNALDHVIFFDNTIFNIPPGIFGIKNNNFRSIFNDFFVLRRCIKKINDVIVVPHANFRWNLILLPKKFSTVCSSNQNIYVSYRKFYNLEQIEKFTTDNSSRVVYIYPESRQINKIIDSELCEKICEVLKRNGYITKQVIINNSNYKFSKNIETLFVNNFKGLIDTINFSNFIVSADSLPVHIAYWKSKITFVFSPIINYKMFPDAVIENDAWALFNDVNKFEKWLKLRNDF